MVCDRKAASLKKQLGWEILNWFRSLVSVALHLNCPDDANFISKVFKSVCCKFDLAPDKLQAMWIFWGGKFSHLQGGEGRAAELVLGGSRCFTFHLENFTTCGIRELCPSKVPLKLH